MSAQPTDHELLQLFRLPEEREKAYTNLIRKYQEKLYWHIRRMVIHHEDANDVLQNVLIKVWRGLDQFREDAQLFTWMYRIATNESLTYLEQQKKRATTSMELIPGGLEDRVEREKGFDAQKLEWKLQLAIQQLPEKQKIVFNLRYYDELPYEQMSEILETSVGALKASYHHAVKKIEDFMLNH